MTEFVSVVATVTVQMSCGLRFGCRDDCCPSQLSLGCLPTHSSFVEDDQAFHTWRSILPMCTGWDSSAEDDLSLHSCCTSLSVLGMNAVMMLTAGPLVLLAVNLALQFLVSIWRGVIAVVVCREVLLFTAIISLDWSVDWSRDLTSLAARIGLLTSLGIPARNWWRRSCSRALLSR